MNERCSCCCLSRKLLYNYQSIYHFLDFWFLALIPLKKISGSCFIPQIFTNPWIPVKRNRHECFSPHSITVGGCNAPFSCLPTANKRKRRKKKFQLYRGPRSSIGKQHRCTLKYRSVRPWRFVGTCRVEGLIVAKSTCSYISQLCAQLHLQLCSFGRVLVCSFHSFN